MSARRTGLVCAGVFAAARAFSLVVAWLAAKQNRVTVGLLLRGWDGGHYTQIATQGYRLHELAPREEVPQDVAFFPGYPMTARVLAAVFGHRVVWLVALALGCSVAAAFVIGVLLRTWFSHDVAVRSVALLAFFPSAFVFNMTYAEGPFLLFVALCLLALARGRWVWAGAACLVAGLVRPNALAVMAAVGVTAFITLRYRFRWQPVVGVVLAPLGFLAYWVWLIAVSGRWTVYTDVQRQTWDQRLDPGLRALWNVGQVLIGERTDVNAVVYVSALVVGVGLFAWAILERLPLVLVTYSAGILVLVVFAHQLLSTPRFVMAAFPLFIPPARRLPVPVFAAVVGGLAAIGGVLQFIAHTSTTYTP